MKKNTALLLALFAVSVPGWAGWTQVQESPDGIVYVDRDGAEKTAHGWKADSSQDFHNLQRHGDHE